MLRTGIPSAAGTASSGNFSAGLMSAGQQGSTGTVGAWTPVGQSALSPQLALHTGMCPQSLVLESPQRLKLSTKAGPVWVYFY